MRAVAAGHPATADAGAEILLEGGTAADAAVAATLASCVAETVMTGLLAGGHGIYFDAATGRACAGPGVSRRRRAAWRLRGIDRAGAARPDGVAWWARHRGRPHVIRGSLGRSRRARVPGLRVAYAIWAVRAPRRGGAPARAS